MSDLELKSVTACEAEYPNPRSFSLLGFNVHAFRNEDVVSLVSYAINAQRHYVVGNHNIHSLYLSQREREMARFYSMTDFVLIDGMPLTLLGRMLGLPLTRRHRATSLEFMPLLLPEAAREGWRIYYLGSKPGVAERAATKLKGEYPGLQIRTHHGYFSMDKSGRDNQDVLTEIETFAPHVLFVGMGMPRQESWILANYKEIRAHVIFPCGAHMDYVAGEIPTAPRWLGRLYLEWLYRIFAEPARLWRRYLLEPWFVFARFILDRFTEEYPKSRRKPRIEAGS